MAQLHYCQWAYLATRAQNGTPVPRNVKCRSCQCDIDLEHYLEEYIATQIQLQRPWTPHEMSPKPHQMQNTRPSLPPDTGSIPDLAEVRYDHLPSDPTHT